MSSVYVDLGRHKLLYGYKQQLMYTFIELFEPVPALYPRRYHRELVNNLTGPAVWRLRRSSSKPIGLTRGPEQIVQQVV